MGSLVPSSPEVGRSDIGITTLFPTPSPRDTARQVFDAQMGLTGPVLKEFTVWLDEGWAAVVAVLRGLSCLEADMWTPEYRTLVGDFGSGQVVK
jgi:hypothetical protein